MQDGRMVEELAVEGKTAGSGRPWKTWGETVRHDLEILAVDEITMYQTR